MQVQNHLPSATNFKTFGSAYAPVQLLGGSVEDKIDLGRFHRFGEMTYAVVYVRRRSGKLEPVSFRGYYVFNASFSQLSEKYADIPKGDVILSAKDNCLVTTGMTKYPNESITHPRAYMSPGIMHPDPCTSLREQDAEHDTGDESQAVSVTGGADGTVDSTSTDVRRVNGTSVPQGARPRPSSLADDRAVVNAAPSPAPPPNKPPEPPRTPPTRPPGPSPLDEDPDESADATVAEGRTSSTGDDAAAAAPRALDPTSLPTFRVLRDMDTPIVFKAGHAKNPDKNPKWASYSKASTTKEYHELGGRTGDWNYDLKHGIVMFADAAMQKLADQKNVLSRVTLRRTGTPHSAYHSSEAAYVDMVTKATFMDMLGGRTAYDGNSDDLDLFTMAAQYDIMRAFQPHQWRALDFDVMDDIRDSLELHCVDSGCDEVSVFLNVEDQQGFTVDERMLTCLKGYSRDERLRMVRAISKEIRDLLSAGTFELAELPRGRRAIGGKLVLKVKYKADGSFDKDKARLVAQGFCERIGKDFYSTFSPMASLTAVRTLFAIAVHHRLPIYHADIPNAFVRAETETELFMNVPKGVCIYDKNDPAISTDNGWVLRLLKSLYGLKDAGQLFNKELDKFFADLGYTRGNSETSMYYRHGAAGWIVVLTEVDDLVITGTDFAAIDELRASLVQSFAKKLDDGRADAASIHWELISSFMGIDINYDVSGGVLTMNVKSKVDALFDEFKFIQKIGHSKTPFPPAILNESFVEEGTWSELELQLKKHYASIVGSIIYMSITCRPDITCATSKLARGMHGPSRFLVNLLKYTLRYLNDHRDTSLVYRANNSTGRQHFTDMMGVDPAIFSLSSSADGDVDGDTDICVGFSDANYAASNAEKRRSTSGWAYFVYASLVSWKSKLQPLTAGSTHEAELIALSFASDEGVWLRKFLGEIGFAVGSVGKPVHVQFPTGHRDAQVHLASIGPTPAYHADIPHAFLPQHGPTADDVVGEPESLLNMPPTPVFVDNAGTVKTANNPVSSTQSSKHLEVRYFRVRDWIRHKLLRVIFCRTHQNLADFFTKPLPTPAFQGFLHTLMGCRDSGR